MRRTLTTLQQWRLRGYALLALRLTGWRRKALAAYGASRFPGTPRALTLFAACDERYFWDYGLAFVFSVEALGAPQDVHLHLCQPSPRTLAQLAKLAASLGAVRLTYTWDHREASDRFWFPAVYYGACRFILAHFLLAETRSPVFCVDIDALVVQPLAGALPAEGFDVGLILRAEQKHPRLKTMAGALQLNPTPEGAALAHAFARQMLAGLATRPDGHIDQAGLYFLCRMERMIFKRVRWRELSKRFCDSKFQADGIIWTAKGDQKSEECYVARKRALLDRYASLVIADNR